MKKVLTVGIGGKSFTIEDEAYLDLKNFLEAFRTKSSLGIQSAETMHDLEQRVAELFSSKMGSFKNVVDSKIVYEVTSQLGMPDGQPYVKEDSTGKVTGNASASSAAQQQYYDNVPKKFYRDPDHCSIGGVCSGLGLYFNIDTVLIRIIIVVLFFAGCFGFLLYVILWIVAPKAHTPLEKCEMRGLPATAENLAKFSYSK